MKRIFIRASLTLGISLVLGLISFKALVLPYAQKKIEAKAERWLEKEGLQLQYRKIHLAWAGIRMDRVILERDSVRMKTDLEIRWHFTWDEKIVGLERVIFLKPRVIAERGDRQQNQKSGKTHRKRSPNFEDVLGRWIDMGMAVEIRRGELEIFDSQAQKLLEVKDLNLDFNPIDRAAQLSMKDVAFRQNPILAELQGQVLFHEQREHFPIIFHARDPGGEPWQLQGQIARNFDRIEFKHKRSGLPAAWSEKLPFIADAGKLRFLVTLAVEGLLKDSDIRYDLKLTSSNLMIQHRSLGPEHYGPWPMSVRAKGSLGMETGRFSVQNGLFFLVNKKRKNQPIRIEFNGQKADLFASLETHPLQVEAKMRSTPCQAALDVLPRNVIPMLDDFELAGEFQGAARFDLFTPGQILNLDESLNKFGCRLLKVPEILTKQWLFNPNAPAPEEMSRNPSMVALKSERFTDRSRIPDDFFRGVVAAEDSGFWRHQGLRVQSLIAALEANFKAGHVVFGGSTITMQLVKNLYLPRDRVITRKLQEVFLAWAIEQTLTKAEILEIYANVIEFAPRAWGISQGSKLYFGKKTEGLNRAESLFLASILPSPERNFSESFCGASLRKGLQDRMMRIASDLAVLSREGDFLSTYERDLFDFQFAPSGSCSDIAGRKSDLRERRF